MPALNGNCSLGEQRKVFLNTLSSTWACQGLNLRPSAHKASGLPLSHTLITILQTSPIEMNKLKHWIWIRKMGGGVSLVSAIDSVVSQLQFLICEMSSGQTQSSIQIKITAYLIGGTVGSIEMFGQKGSPLLFGTLLFLSA